VEAVIDKDLTAALLGRQLRADALLLLTDVPAVQDGDGTPLARAIRLVPPAALRARKFPAVSMGPKLEAACRFVEATGKMAAIGQLADAQALLAPAGRNRHYCQAERRLTCAGVSSVLLAEAECQREQNCGMIVWWPL
jgi:carbamate kinase